MKSRACHLQPLLWLSVGSHNGAIRKWGGGVEVLAAFVLLHTSWEDKRCTTWVFWVDVDDVVSSVLLGVWLILCQKVQKGTVET